MEAYNSAVGASGILSQLMCRILVVDDEQEVREAVQRRLEREGYKVILKQKPGREKLSKREIGKLLEVTERFRQLENFELSEATHQFQEWQQHFHEGTATPIPWEDVLRAQGKPEMIAVAQKEAATQEALAMFFGS